jgi:putative ABC transport system substrate-binding protein
MSSRRDFITLLGGSAAAWPLAVHALEPAKLPTIGYLGLGSGLPSAYASRVEALRSGLRALGWVEGKNIAIEFRWADRVDQLPALAFELVRLPVDVIFANSSTLVEAARQATHTIPIVFSNHADPVGVGHVASLARPGGNITGLSMLLTELSAKELEMLTEVLPRAKCIGVIWNPTTPSHSLAVRAVEEAGEKLKLKLVLLPARTVDDFAGAFTTMVREQTDGFIDIISPLSTGQRSALVELALRLRQPGVFGTREFVDAGGLMSYGADIEDLHRRAALYIDKILKGAKPADLPVEQASKYQLIINLKTAKSLGIEVPATLLARADEVIE